MKVTHIHVNPLSGCGGCGMIEKVMAPALHGPICLDGASAVVSSTQGTKVPSGWRGLFVIVSAPTDNLFTVVEGAGVILSRSDGNVCARDGRI